MLESPMELKKRAVALPKPNLRKGSLIRELIELGGLVISIYVLVNLASVRFIVQGPSMQPSFYDGNFLIVSRVNYLFGEPEHGDIAVFHYPNDPDKDYIKRVIGVPGDVVEMLDTHVYVNGVRLEEPYIAEPCDNTSGICRDNRWELGQDQFFVMGDNRNHSSDSRSFGPVDRQYLVGEVILRYWPPSDWGFITGGNWPAN